MNHPVDMPALHANLRDEGFAFVTARVMRTLLHGEALDDWDAFADSWNELSPDTYLAASGRHRRRRYATFAAGREGEIRREPAEPHFQSRSYNHLQGDIQRWCDPILPAGDGPSLRRILEFCRDFFGSLAPATTQWHIETHQFRIEARRGEDGEPTPEGVHRDGVDYVLVLLIDRLNIASGTTTIHAPDRRVLGSFTLAQPLDAALVDDARVLHGVTAVTPIDPDKPAHRDVLVVTFRSVTGG
jgi:hypothetical protein